MTEEEIKGYGNWFANAVDSDKIIEKLSDIKEDLIYRGVENISGELSKIVSSIEEELIAAKELNLQEEIEKLNSIINTCDEFLAAEKTEMFGENLTEEELTPKQIVFAKSDAGNFYVTSDMKKIRYSEDVYNRLKSVFELIQSGCISGNPTIARKFKNNPKHKNVIEYKNYQVRVYTKNLADNVVCVIGIRIKKDNNPKSILTFLTNRCKMIEQAHTLENMSEMIANGQKEELLAESKEELNKIMNILKKQDSKESVEVSEVTPEKENMSETEIVETPKEDNVTEAPEDKSLIEEDFLSDLPNDWRSAYKLVPFVLKEKGTIDVKTTYVFETFPFGKWIKAQKDAKDKGLLSDKQIKLLEEFGIKWHTKAPKVSATKSKKMTPVPKNITDKPIVQHKKEEQWMIRYNLAKKFYEQYGDLKIPNHYVDPETEIKLGIWISNQRNAYKNGKLSENRIKLLEEIGMIWSVRSRKQKHEAESQVEDVQEIEKISQIEDVPKIENIPQTEEIEILDLYPEEKQIEDDVTGNVETQIHIEEENSNSYDKEVENSEETAQNIETSTAVDEETSENIDTQADSTTENEKNSLISQITTSLNGLDIETLYKIQKTIKNLAVQTDLESELNQVYEGLLKMNPDELNEFVIQLENVELPSYKGKK